MKTLNIISSLLVTGLGLVAVNAEALSTISINLGDPTVENVQIGYSGNPNLENLEYWFTQNGVTNPDGTVINPTLNQTQDELFFTDVTRSYQVEFLGIGYASYHSPFGVCSYAGDPYAAFDPTKMTYYKPLFVQNEVAKNTVYDFTITGGSYFGFYLNSNKSGTYLSTMISSNKDKLDHAIFFNTNKGYTITFEDIVGGGDRDYEDLVVNIKPLDGSGFNSVPEPSTMFLFGAGLFLLLGGLRKKLQG